MADLPIRALDATSRLWALAVAAICLVPLLLQLPGPTAWAIAATAAIIATLSWQRPLSLVVRALLAIAVLAAILLQFEMRFGRDTGCALLGAMLAIKPSETTSLRDGRSLIGFALFAPFATFLLDQGPLSLVLGLIGVVAALATLHRLAALEGGVELASAVAPLRHAGRLLALGLPLAMAVFWLFPRMGSPLWGVPERSQARVGLSGDMSPGDWTDLLVDDSVALRARFDGPAPARDALYWRGPVLWDFDGRTWRRPEGLEALPPADIVPGPARWSYRLEVEPTERTMLVALDVPLEAPPGARLTPGRSLETAQRLRLLSRWQLVSAPAAQFQVPLPDPLRQLALTLPAGYNPRAVALARQLRARHGRDDAAIVRDVLGWIRRDFAYSLSAPELGRDTVDEFLFVTQVGYCEHFAGAFTVLMRAAGIPTRVVTGYAGGTWNALGGYWMIRNSDAHAWTEVWLPGTGWTRVDPTAAVAPSRILDTVEDRRSAGGLLGVLEGPGAFFQLGDWMRQRWNDAVLGFDARRQARLFQPLGLERAEPRHLIAVFAAAAALALGLMVAISLRAPRERDPVLRAWHSLGRRYARIGLGREPHEPADAWAERISKTDPQRTAGVLDITARFTQWRYARLHVDSESMRRLVRDLRAHRPS